MLHFAVSQTRFYNARGRIELSRNFPKRDRARRSGRLEVPSAAQGKARVGIWRRGPPEAEAECEISERFFDRGSWGTCSPRQWRNKGWPLRDRGPKGRLHMRQPWGDGGASPKNLRWGMAIL